MCPAKETRRASLIQTPGAGEINKAKAKGQRMVASTEIICGDCSRVLERFGDNTFDLIVTSPPYADQRTKTYGGIKPSEYVGWFLARSEEFSRVAMSLGT